MTNRHTLAASHIGVAVAAFGVAALMGVTQALSMADISFPMRSETLYYVSLTAHGVLMGLVFTTFFIMALGYALAEDTLVHNTAFIQGHFHLTLGTTVALTFMGATYYLLPRLLGRELRFPGLARMQPYLWFGGMTLFSTSYHIAGILGMPRRVFSGSLAGEQGAEWHTLTLIAAIGGVVLSLSALAYVVVVVATWTSGRRIEPPAIEFAVPLRPEPEATIWDRLGLWTAVAVVLILIAYAYPLMQLISHPRYGSPGFQPF